MGGANGYWKIMYLLCEELFLVFLSLSLSRICSSSLSVHFIISHRAYSAIPSIERCFTVPVVSLYIASKYWPNLDTDKVTGTFNPVTLKIYFGVCICYRHLRYTLSFSPSHHSNSYSLLL